MKGIRDTYDLSETERRLSMAERNQKRLKDELEDIQSRIAENQDDDSLVIIAQRKTTQIDMIQANISKLTSEVQAEQITEQTKQIHEIFGVQNIIRIIDAPCGKGKTSWAIQYMNDVVNKDKKFIFITPFLDEVDRIKSGCKDRSFKAPVRLSQGSKSASLKRLLTSGENIVSTHNLFSRIDADTIRLIQMGGYTLILDEVMDVVRQEHIDKHDIEMLISQDLISVDDNGTVCATENSKGYSGRFDDIILDARMNRLIYVDNTLMLWQFPVDIFNAFDEVYNLTYMFDGQIQKYYYDFNNVQYRYHSVELTDGRYKLTGYDPVNGDIEFRRIVKEYLRIYNGPLNLIGKGKYDLSVSYHNKASAPILKKIQNNTYNFFRNVSKGNKSKDNMWTCFKGQQDKLKGNGYAKGFVEFNARATNQYRHKTTLAYLVNRFPRTAINRYFQTKDIKIDADQYALSELIQWVWRSQIRNGKSINLYIPSSRMRGLLHDWIDGKVSIDLAA